MTILLLRTEAKIQESCARFSQAGIEAVGLPLLKTVENALPLHELQETFASAPANSKLIFVSTPAATIALKHLGKWLKHFETISVGQSTASVLRTQGFDPIVPEVETSEGLLSLPVLQHIRNCHVFLMKGTGGRQALKNGLGSKGAKCIEVELYRRQKIAQPQATMAWKQTQINCIIATSGELIESAFERFEVDWLRQTPWIVVSQRTADIATTLGIKSVKISAGASDSALIEATQHLLER